MKSISNVPGDYHYWALHEANSIRRSWYINKLRLVELIMPATGSDFVVDAGCGSGFLSAFLADSCKHCVGIDIGSEVIRFASEKFSAKKNLRFIESNMADAPITHNAIDKIYCIEVIEHLNFSDAKSTLGTLYYWLKRGGQLLITTPNYKSFWPVLEWLIDTFAVSPRVAKMANNDNHIAKFSPGSLDEILTRSGFSVDKLGSFDFVSPFIAPFSRKLSLKLADREIMSSSTCGNLIYARCTKQ